MSTPPLPVLIDTDPGLDDAVAILYALADARFSVAAITAVAGNIGLSVTTRNVGGLLSAMGRNDVPYAAGAAGPMQGEGRDEVAIHGADGLGGVTLPGPLAAPDGAGATHLLADVLMQRPEGALTVLALGPLTNLALLARDMPKAYARIGRIIAMGGAIEAQGNAGPHAEFNMASDPLAAQIVFDASVPVTLIPLDVTRQVRATMEDLDRLAAMDTVAATLSADVIRAYFVDNSGRASRPLHDPCVMLMAHAPQLFGTRMMPLRVDGAAEPGRLVPTPEGASIEVAMTVDAPAALDALWRGLGT